MRAPLRKFRPGIRGQECDSRGQRDRSHRHKCPSKIVESENARARVEKRKTLQATGSSCDSKAQGQLLATDDKLTARLICNASISAKAIALRLVNSSERKKPPTKSRPS
jgi:hypothetical protein